MTKKTRIIIAESKDLLRKGIVALLKTQSDLDVIEEACNGRELLEQLKHMTVDLVLLEINIPVVDAKTVLNVIHTRFPDTRVIILSDQLNAQLQSDFMAHGANGFLYKDCTIETFYHAINKVKTEGFFFDNSTSKALLATIVKDKHRITHPMDAHLNEREIDVLKRICNGNTNKEIAIDLHLSASTIDFYRTKIYSKTNCHNVTGLLKYAIKNGFVSLS